MRAYKLTINGKAFSNPFVHHEDAMKLLAKVDFKDVQTILIEAVEIGVNDYFRNGNVIYQKDDANNGILRGVYYADHPESI